MYDHLKLEEMLRNEADMAFKRRVKVILEYLEIRHNDNVLDCGCGLGFHLMLIRELYDCHLAGIDISLGRLTKAKQELAGKDVHLALGDILHLPYKDNSFDKVVLSEVLEHLSDDRAALDEVKRILKPGGVAAITVPNRNFPFLWDPINKTLEFFSADPIKAGLFGGIWTDHLRLYTPSGLTDLVSRSGLILEDLQLFTHYCFPFTHNLVYGIGKPLVESGLLPKADRFRFKDNSRSVLNPINLGIKLFNLIDRLNSDLSKETTYVSISVKATKDE